MAKVALLIGVSQYTSDFNALPSAERDIVALQRILENSEMGGFDRVQVLSNPEPIAMQEAIETLFSERERNDLVLLFFSGHGVRDDRGRLYFATHSTRKTPKGELAKATAVPASFIQDIMSHSRCKRQVVILDCCFSGAFAEGMTAKDDGAIDLKAELGGEGRAILTSSTSTQYSFSQDEADLSLYTRYLAEGIESGAADLDSDGMVSLDELHEYASRKVREAAPAMSPEIYRFREGHKILLTKAPITNPQLRYRREVEKFAGRGRISVIGRSALDVLRERLSLSLEETSVIEAEVLKPHQEHRNNLLRYEQTLRAAMASEDGLTPEGQEELDHLQQFLGLRPEDVEPIKAEIASSQIAAKTEGQSKQLAELYTQALKYLRHEQWMEAIQAFDLVIRQQSDYEDATTKLAEAKRKQQIAELITQAETAYTQQSWPEVIRALEAIAQIDPNYREIKARLEGAKRQQRLANLYGQARRWFQERQWQRVIDVFREIQAIDKAYPDPDALWASARQQLRAVEFQKQQQKLADLYRLGEQAAHGGKRKRAIELFEEVCQIDPSYHNAQSLLAELRQKSIQGNPLLGSIAIIVVGWLLSGTIADQVAFAGAFGGFINGWAFLPAHPEKHSAPLQKLIVQILLFSLAGAVLGLLVWQLVELMGSHDNRDIQQMGGIGAIKAFISAILGIGTLFAIYYLVWTRSDSSER